jgi:propanol-preferring alcohol dehydrogenase
LSIFDTVLNRITIRDSIVGTRKDLQEAIQFAVEGKVKATVTSAKLEDVNDVFEKMKKVQIEGRVVLEIAKQ